MKECSVCGYCASDEFDTCPEDNGWLERTFEGISILDGKYKLERRCGHGAMGAVYRAVHIDLQKTFAVKLVKCKAQGSRPDYVARFRIEAKALGRLEHPNIVSVTDFGVDPRGQGIPYLVMEYLDGLSLDTLIARGGALPPEIALPIIDGLAAALSHAHSSGILHRDLKPGNVLVVGEPPSVKLLDLGLAALVDPDAVDEGIATLADASIARLSLEASPEHSIVETVRLDGQPHAPSRPLKSRLTIDGTILGTPAFMPPEVILGHLHTSASDIYSFGVLIFELLTGKRLFTGSIMQILNDHVSSAPPSPSQSNPRVSKEVSGVVLRMLDKDPSRRPPSAAAAAAELMKAYHDAQVRMWKRRAIPQRIGAAVLMSVCLCLLAAGLCRWAPLAAIEDRLVDVRFLWGPVKGPDPRIVLVSIDERALASDPTPLSLRAAEFSSRLGRVLNSGASGVGIDLLLPQVWSQSAEFSAFLLQHHGQLVLAAFTTSEGAVKGPEAIPPLVTAALGPSGSQRLFAFVNQEADSDGVFRRFRPNPVDVNARSTSGFPQRACDLLLGGRASKVNDFGRVWIDASVATSRFERISWADLPASLECNTFRGRLVIVGAEYEGSGDTGRKIPHPRWSPALGSGLVMQALMIGTLLNGMPVREIGWVIHLAWACLLGSLGGAVILCMRTIGKGIAFLFFSAGLHILLAIVMFRLDQFLIPMFHPILVIVLSVASSIVLLRRLSPYPKNEYGGR